MVSHSVGVLRAQVCIDLLEQFRAGVIARFGTIRRAFDQWDEDGSRQLDMEECACGVVVSHSVGVLRAQVCIDLLEQFRAGVIARFGTIRRAFDQWDEDGSRQLDMEECAGAASRTAEPSIAVESEPNAAPQTRFKSLKMKIPASWHVHQRRRTKSCSFVWRLRHPLDFVILERRDLSSPAFPAHLRRGAGSVRPCTSSAPSAGTRRSSSCPPAARQRVFGFLTYLGSAENC